MKILSKVTVAVAALALVLGTASVASATSFTYTGVLKYGSRGASVSSLQTCLNAEGMNAGFADGIFGMGTKGAVTRFQAANNLVADGVVGPMTASKLDCSTGVVVNNNNNNNNGGPVDLNAFIINGGKEVDLQDFEAKDGDDDSVVEGAKSQEIAHFEFTPEDSDFLLERVHFVFAGADGLTQDENVDASDVFGDITLLINGDEVDTIDASDTDNWDDDKYGIRDDYGYTDDASDDVMSLPFAGINEILDEGDNVVITLEADIQSSVDGADDSENWDIYIPVDGLRGIDTSGNTSYLGDDSDSASVTVESEGADNAFDIKTSTGNPDAQTVEVDDTNRTTFMALEFKIEADENGEDLQINSLSVEGATGVEDYSDVVYETTLEIDGEEYDVDVVNVTNGASDCDYTNHAYTEGTTTPCLTWDFDRNEVVVEAGDTVTAKLWVEVNDLDGIAYNAGETLEFAVHGEAADVEGDDSKEDVTDLGGSVTGETQTLYVEAVSAELGTVTYTETEDTNGATTKVVYTIPVKVTAFGNTFYVPFGAIRDTANATSGIDFQIEDGSGTVVTDLSDEIGHATALNSTATTSGSYWRIDEGDTETITFNVSVIGETLDTVGAANFATDYFKVQLLGLRYDDDTSGTPAELVLTPAQDFETVSRQIDA